MKLLIVSSSPQPHVGGKSTHIDNLRKGLVNLGHTVCIVSPTWIPAFVRCFLISGISQVLKHATGQWGKASIVPIWHYRLSEFFLTRAVIRVLRSGGFDAVSAQDVIGASIARCLLGNGPTPLTLTVHGDQTNEWVSVGAVLRGSAAERWLIDKERRGYLAADRILTVDTRLYHHVCDVIGSQVSPPVHVLHNFVDVDEFRPIAPEEKRQLRERFGYRTTTLIILCPRRLWKKNGVIYAAEAMAHLKHFLPPDHDFRLLFAGDGGDARRILELRAQHHLERQIELLGDVSHPEMPELFQIADVVLIPSVPAEGVVEATSIAALEAMASGVPVIASDIGGLTELIHHERTGLLVPPADPQAIAQTIVGLLDDQHLYQELARNARQHVVEHHSHLSAAAEFIALCGAPYETAPRQVGS